MKLKNPLSADELEQQIAAASNIKDEEVTLDHIASRGVAVTP